MGSGASATGGVGSSDSRAAVAGGGDAILAIDANLAVGRGRRGAGDGEAMSDGAEGGDTTSAGFSSAGIGDGDAAAAGIGDGDAAAAGT